MASRARRAGSAGIVAAAFVVLALGGCKYDPKFEDGMLRCSTAAECPEGYSCRGALCYSGVPADLFIGDWALGIASMVSTQCDDGSRGTTLLSTDPNDPSVMTIGAGNAGPADLSSIWLCTLPLRITTTGAHLSGNGVDPYCFDDTSDPASTWTASQFDVVTRDGVTATHAATYARLDEYAAGGVVHCTQHVTATLTKM